MKKIALRIHAGLLKKNKSVAVAESCSAGLLSQLLTDNPGSSAYFLLGIVAYSNKSKNSLLTLPLNLIKEKGAVSAPVAKAMACSVRRLAKADFGIGITGIAGPAGGTKRKPIGTVFIAASAKNNTLCKRFNFRGKRNSIKKKSALAALELLEKLL